MPSCVDCMLLEYVDESALIVSDKDPSKIGQQLSKNLGCCTKWLIDNKISLHKGKNKAVLEPRVSPAFAITYFCNHCNIRFENTSKYVDTLTLFSKNLNQRSLTPR